MVTDFFASKRFDRRLREWLLAAASGLGLRLAFCGQLGERIRDLLTVRRQLQHHTFTVDPNKPRFDGLPFGIGPVHQRRRRCAGGQGAWRFALQ